MCIKESRDEKSLFYEDTKAAVPLLKSPFFLLLVSLRRVALTHSWLEGGLCIINEVSSPQLANREAQYEDASKKIQEDLQDP